MTREMMLASAVNTPATACVYMVCICMYVCMYVGTYVCILRISYYNNLALFAFSTHCTETRGEYCALNGIKQAIISLIADAMWRSEGEVL